MEDVMQEYEEKGYIVVFVGIDGKYCLDVYLLCNF